MNVPINTTADGCCPTIKANYYKAGVANLIQGLRHYPHGGGTCCKVGQISTGKSQTGTVYHTKQAAPTVCSSTHGYSIYHILVVRKIEQSLSQEREE